MLVDITSALDLDRLEDCIRQHLGAQRLDVSVLRSKPYLDLRTSILKHIDGGQDMPGAPTVFAQNNLIVRLVCRGPPLTMWVGACDVNVCDDDNPA